jgi:hypothetical protein
MSMPTVVAEATIADLDVDAAGSAADDQRPSYSAWCR